MDLLLFNGDHAKDQRGFPVPIADERELLQQALIRLSIPKGAFALDANLGSLLYSLGTVPAHKRQEFALQFAKEALVGLQGVSVQQIICRLPQVDVLELEIWLVVNTKKFATKFNVVL